MKPICLALALICCLLQSCRKNKDSRLTIPLTPYSGSELRMDGYYYYLSEESLKNGDTFYYAFIPFSDGKMFYTGTSSLATMEENFSKPAYERSKAGWGAFKIETNVIAMEYWTYVLFNGALTTTAWATIINDTSFVLTSQNKPSTSPQELNHTYLFKYCTTKPNINPDFYN